MACRPSVEDYATSAGFWMQFRIYCAVHSGLAWLRDRLQVYSFLLSLQAQGLLLLGGLPTDLDPPNASPGLLHASHGKQLLGQPHVQVPYADTNASAIQQHLHAAACVVWACKTSSALCKFNLIMLLLLQAFD